MKTKLVLLSLLFITGILGISCNNEPEDKTILDDLALVEIQAITNHGFKAKGVYGLPTTQRTTIGFEYSTSPDFDFSQIITCDVENNIPMPSIIHPIYSFSYQVDETAPDNSIAWNNKYFTAETVDLQKNTKYYIRPVAKSISGITYGVTQSFETKTEGSCVKIIYKDMGATNQILNVLIRSTSKIAFTSIVLTELLSDNASNSSIAADDLTMFIFPNNGLIDDLFHSLYAAVSASNFIVSMSNLVMPHIDCSINQHIDFQELFLLTSHAHYTRAYAYYLLTHLWGDVPLCPEENKAIEDMNETVRRRSKDYLEKLIIQDLLQAKQDEKKIGNIRSRGFFSPDFANVLLSKIYFDAGQYQLALTYADSVINSNHYELTSNYNSLFTSHQASESFMTAMSTEIQLHGILSLPNATSTLANKFSISDLRKDISLDENTIKKYQDEKNAFIPLCRYAEILLLAAESALKTSDKQKALSYVNKVRARAGLAALENTLSDEQVLVAIINERQLELCFEGNRWFDLIRTGTYMTVLKDKGIQAHHRLLPIPASQISFGTTQNPGY